MASTAEEPDLFNDVEIMEIGEFTTESDENYVSVELLSDNDDDDETDNVLDTIPLCPPEDLLCVSTNSRHTPTAHSEDTEPHSEQDRYVMESVSQHRFLSDHQYLVGSSMHHIVPREETNDHMSMHVQRNSERFSVSYDMDIRTQDLFNKETNSMDRVCFANGENNRNLTTGEYEKETHTCNMDDEYFECKIEIGETILQSWCDIVGNEEVSTSEEVLHESDSEEVVVRGLLHGMPSLTMMENDKITPLANDHSYTTLYEDTFQSSGTEESCGDRTGTGADKNVAELVRLSNRLANERNKTSLRAKEIVDKIEQELKSFRIRQHLQAEQMNVNNRTVHEDKESVADADNLSVVLSTNCSERLENESGIPSSSASAVIMNENGNDDSGTDTDCTAARKKVLSFADEAAPYLDKLILLGDNFTNQLQQWLETHSGETGITSVDMIKITRLMAIFDKIKGQYECSAKGNPMDKVEIAIQTDIHSSSAEKKQRALNEKYKKTMLAAASDSSSLSDSDDSAPTTNLDSDKQGEDMMSDFVRRRRMRKIAKEKRNKTSLRSDAANNDGECLRLAALRRNQIYSDSSSESDGQQQSRIEERDERADVEDNLLEGVLSGVDDIMLDVHDILPAAEDVVQDYLEKEEVRNKRQDGDRAEADEDAEIHSEISTVVSNLKDMTESELEEYNEQQQDKEIDRLCNISYLSVGRSTVAAAGNTNATAAKCKEAQQKKKKTENTMENFLNDENSSNATIPLVLSDNSDGSDKNAVDTEEQFLQIYNEAMKYQLLNQLSSSEVSSDDAADNEIAKDSVDKIDSEDDSDASSGNILNSFLMRLDTNRIKRKEWINTSKQVEGNDALNRVENGEIAEGTPGSNCSNSASDEMALKNLSDMEVGSGEETIDDTPIKNEDPKQQQKVVDKQGKMELADPKDRSLFSRNMLKDDVDELRDKIRSKLIKPGKVKTRSRLDSLGTPLSFESFTDDNETSVDSDLELLQDSPKKQKRARDPSPSLEPFDFSEPLLSVTSARKDSLSNSGTSGTTTEQTTANSCSKGASDTAVESPAACESTSTTAAATKVKSSAKEDQDCISLSSDSDAETETITGEMEDSSRAPQENKRKIRAMLTNDELAEETKKAQKEEEGRVVRLRKKNETLKKFLPSFRPRAGESELVLDYDTVVEQAICVHPDIVKLLKPHQLEGIKFMYDNTYGSVDTLAKHPGSGCILAHCMGLGKTLQMIALLHTVMRYPQLLTRRVLVICPKSTVMNWKEEIIRWQGTIQTGYQMRVFCFADVCTQDDKVSVLRKWFSCTTPNCGVMLIGYEAFRALINYERRKRPADMPHSSKLERIKEYLLNPGADLVICDEGHQIKNKRSAISEAVSKIKTKRRIMLTGTPIQNNLKEYYCMVNFIKPSFLGSDKEFSNLYANPIKNGQCKDSDQRAIKIMKQRSYVLHNKLSKFVQRKEAAVLKEFLPEKYEYVLFVPLTPVQEKMYEVFLQMNEYTSSNETAGEPGRTKKFKLIADYTSLRKIWTHPKVLEKAWESAIQEKNRKDAARKTSTPDSYDESPDDNNDIASGQLSVTNDWWRRFLEVADLESLFPSNKLWIMFEILKQCNERGEKCLIFSAFVAVLNVVEHFMAKIHHQSDDPQQSDVFAYSAFKGPWEPGKDYYRLDGRTHKSIRHKMITSFNDPRNTRTKCFLISAKAGGQGINLTGANRVIILDTSWNPSNDQQNIFRIFRLGQKRKCYVYRLLAMGTMEEKVYSRSVTKQALSFRVVDEQQIDRHYSYGELAELYTLTKVSEMTRETPILPADDVLALLLRIFPNKIFKYHEHDSLLENKPEQDLSEEEKNEAWAAYEREIQTNENRSLMSPWGSVSQAGLFAQPGPYGTLIDYWNRLNYPSMTGTYPMVAGGDMFRTDFSYSRSAYNAHAIAQQQQQYSMLGDTPYSSLLAKPYGGLPLPNPGGLDFGSPMMNGQSSGSLGGLGGTAKQYDPTAALANFFNLYSAKSATGASGIATGMGGSNQSSMPPLSSSSLGPNPYSGANNSSASIHYNALKHMSDYNALSSALHNAQQSSSTGLPISNATSLSGQHNKSGGPISGQSSSSNIGAGNASMLSMLNEQAQLAATAAVSSSFGSTAVSSPFSPRNVPLLPPMIDPQMRSYMGTSPRIQSPKMQSPRTQSPLPPQATNSITMTSPSPGRSSAATENVSTSINSIPRNASSMPIITSAMTMTSQGSVALDPSNRLPADIMGTDGVIKNISDKNDRQTTSNLPSPTTKPNANITNTPAVPNNTNKAHESSGSLGSSAPGITKRTPTPTSIRPSPSSGAAHHGPTIVPSDDEDEGDVTNKIAPPHVIVRDVGAANFRDNGNAKDTEKHLGTSNMGIAYPEPRAYTKPATAFKDVLKHAKSLTNLTQQQSKQRHQFSHAIGPGEAARIGTSALTQILPSIIPAPNARPLQTFLRANSSSPLTSFGKVKRQSSSTKLLHPARVVVQQQQQTTKPPAIPARSSATVQQQTQNPVLNEDAPPPNLTQLLKPLPLPTIMPSMSSGFSLSGQTASPLPALSKGIVPVSAAKQQSTSTVVARHPNHVVGNVTKSLQKYATEENKHAMRASPGPVTAGKPPSTQSSGAIATPSTAGPGLTKSSIVNPSSRTSPKTAVESRPVTLGLNPLQTVSATVQTDAKGDPVKRVAPNLLKASQSPSTIASLSAGSSGGRSSPAASRPISVVQKSVPARKAAPVANLSSNSLTSHPNQGAVHRTPTPVPAGKKAIAPTTPRQQVSAKLNPNPFRLSPTFMNRFAKATAPIKVTAASSGTLTTGSTPGVEVSFVPVLPTFGSRSYGTAGTAMTVIPTSSIPKGGSPVSTSTSLTSAGSNITKPAVSYSFNHANKDLVITKATASPTIRQILPSQGHIVLKSPTVTTNASVNNEKLSTTSSATTLPSGVTPTRKILPAGMLRAANVAANAAATTTTMQMGNSSQPGGSNNVFIRKRKHEAALSDNVKITEVRSEQSAPGKRTKLAEPTSTETTFLVTNRPGGGITISPKMTPAKGASQDGVFEVVEIE